jgi:predicted RNA-binding Zn ribbon-like protein
MDESVPREVALVKAFVNTRDVEAGTDEIATAEDFGRWLRAHSLVEPDDPVDDADAARAAVLRESLRALLRSAEPDPSTIEAINRAAAGAPLAVRFDDRGRTTLEPQMRGVDAALARILGDVSTAVALGSWERLKACSKDSCQWIFYDRSKNRSGRWCSMSVCGNRTKTRAYRERQRSEVD